MSSYRLPLLVEPNVILNGDLQQDQDDQNGCNEAPPVLPRAPDLVKVPSSVFVDFEPDLCGSLVLVQWLSCPPRVRNARGSRLQGALDIFEAVIGGVPVEVIRPALCALPAAEPIFGRLPQRG